MRILTFIFYVFLLILLAYQNRKFKHSYIYASTSSILSYSFYCVVLLAMGSKQEIQKKNYKSFMLYNLSSTVLSFFILLNRFNSHWTTLPAYYCYYNLGLLFATLQSILFVNFKCLRKVQQTNQRLDDLPS